MSEHTYQPGDKVEVIDSLLAKGYKNGDVLTVKSIDRDGDIYVEGVPIVILRLEVRPYVEPTPEPAPDIITINRNDLPQVFSENNWLRIKESGVIICSSNIEASIIVPHLRRHILESLATIEFLEARYAEDAAAEKLGEQRLTIRREELADFYLGHGYDQAKSGVKQLINVIIERDGTP